LLGTDYRQNDNRPVPYRCISSWHRWLCNTSEFSL